MRQPVPFFLLILFFIVYTVPAAGQVNLRFSGYVVDLPMYQRLPSALASLADLDQDMAVNLTRLRLRPGLDLWEGASLSLEHEVDVLYRSQSMLFAPTAGQTNRQVADLRWQLLEEDHVSLQHYVDRLYFRQNLSWGNIIAGRQRIQWGSGRIWNPTDLFNPINPASFDKIEKDGADAVSAKVYLGTFTDIQAVVNFRRARGHRGDDDVPDSTNAGVRFRTNYSEFDIAVMGGYFDRRVTIGGDFAGNLFGAGVRGEAVYAGDQEHRLNSAYLRLIIGADYQFTPELYGLIEYLYNGEGHTDPGKYELLRLFRGEILNLGTKYLYLGGSYRVHPLVVANIGLMGNPGDGSGFLSLVAGWSSSENSTVSAGLLLPYGGENDEFWYYPASLYLKGELYF
ncbi:MAG: hypothetical protein KFH87_03350 [Bacteroidetes bacterium]|nr:hypothetical protein [Bacteroidota bacterium]